MKYAFILLVSFILAGCAGVPSPFMDGGAEWQTEGATKQNDPERVLGASYITIKALRAGTPSEYVVGLAGALDTAASGSVTNGALSTALESYVESKAKHPEDKMLANYFIAKLSVKTDRVSLPLSAEQKRILKLYADTLRDTVRDFGK